MPTFDAIEPLVTSGKKIQAIKEFRALTGVGLKDAKDAVEWFEAHRQWPAQYLREAAPAPERRPPSDPRLHVVEQEMARGRLINAIKELRTLVHWGLKDTKDAVEAYRDQGAWSANVLAALGAAPAPASAPASSSSPAPSSRRTELERFMTSNQKIGAIKLLRELTHWGLKESKEAVDHYQDHGTWQPAVLAVLDGAAASAPAPAPSPQPTQSPASGPSSVPTAALAKGPMLQALARLVGHPPEILLDARARRVAADGQLVVLRDRTCFVCEDRGQWIIDPVLFHDAVAHVEVHRGIRATLYISLGYLHERFELDAADADAALALLRVFAG